MTPEEIQQHVEEFLASGGAIEVIKYIGDPVILPTPMAGIYRTGTPNRYEGSGDEGWNQI